MTIAEQLGQIAQIKDDIRYSINAKGVILSESAPFNEYPTAIQSILQEGTSNVTLSSLLDFYAEEQVIGRWTNKKPVYLRVINTSLYVESEKAVEIGTMPYVDEGLYFSGLMHSGVVSLQIPNHNTVLAFGQANKKFVFQYNFSGNSKDVDLLLFIVYTKIDDEPMEELPQPPSVRGGTEFLNSYKRELLLEESNWVETDEGYFTMTVECEGVFEDESLQEIFVTPRSVYQRVYDLAGVGVIGQGANTLTFKADKLPEQNLLVQVGIVSAVEVNSEAVVLWSPRMHSDTSPSPYKVYPIDDDMYIAFDGDRETSVIFSTSHKYLTFDFGSIRMVYGVGVYAKTGLIHTLRLLGSIDNENWNLIGEFSLVDLPSNSQKVIMFPSPVSYRYYKVDGSDVASGRNRIYELEFVVEGGNA